MLVLLCLFVLALPYTMEVVRHLSFECYPGFPGDYNFDADGYVVYGPDRTWRIPCWHCGEPVLKTGRVWHAPAGRFVRQPVVDMAGQVFVLKHIACCSAEFYETRSDTEESSEAAA